MLMDFTSTDARRSSSARMYVAGGLLGAVGSAIESTACGWPVIISKPTSFTFGGGVGGGAGVVFSGMGRKSKTFRSTIAR